eukprot:scaffold11561_cov99-Isochrysis_galbana.AAC.3
MATSLVTLHPPASWTGAVWPTCRHTADPSHTSSTILRWPAGSRSNAAWSSVTPGAVVTAAASARPTAKKGPLGKGKGPWHETLVALHRPASPYLDAAEIAPPRRPPKPENRKWWPGCCSTCHQLKVP